MRIKEQPEDFIVTEITSREPTTGPYALIKCTKTNRNTLDVIRFLERKWKTKVGFAGTKDKHAITTQYITAKNVSEKQVKETQVDNVQLEYVGQTPKPLSLGELQGNLFTIKVKGVEKKEVNLKQVENYFDEQRFSANNAEVGRALIRKKLEKACKLIQNEDINKHLQEKPNDYIGALQTLHKKQLTFYFHAYQSLLFNEALQTYVKEQTTDTKEVAYSEGTLTFAHGEIEAIELPLPSFDMPDCKYYKSIFEDEAITQRDFITRHLPQLMQPNRKRASHIRPENFSIEWGAGEASVKFFLPPGSYATMVIKKLF